VWSYGAMERALSIRGRRFRQRAPANCPRRVTRGMESFRWERNVPVFSFETRREFDSCPGGWRDVGSPWERVTADKRRAARQVFDRAGRALSGVTSLESIAHP
jgi:hypothetical protein